MKCDIEITKVSIEPPPSLPSHGPNAHPVAAGVSISMLIFVGPLHLPHQILHTASWRFSDSQTADTTDLLLCIGVCTREAPALHSHERCCSRCLLRRILIWRADVPWCSGLGFGRCRKFGSLLIHIAFQCTL